MHPMSQQKTMWYYMELGSATGPATCDDLVDLFDESVVSSTTLVHACKLPSSAPPPTVSTGWKQLSDVPEIVASLRANCSEATLASLSTTPTSPPPPPPPPPVQRDSVPPAADAPRPQTDWEAQYQAQSSVYQYQPPTSSSSTALTGKKRKRTKPANSSAGPPTKRRRVTPSSSSRSVYATGLPPDVTLTELHTFFSRCGLVVEDQETKLPRIRIYRREADGAVNGDCLVHYVVDASVGLACTILDGAELRPGVPIHVEPAVFKNRQPTVADGAEDASGGSLVVTKTKRRKRKKRQAGRTTSYQRKQLQWTLHDDDVDWKLRSAVIRNMFTPDDALSDPTFKTTLRKDVKQECVLKCGPVEMVRVFPKHPEGIVHVVFKYQYSAQKCVELMEARWFDGKQLRCSLWDGEDFRHKGGVEEEETIEEQLARLEAMTSELREEQRRKREQQQQQ